MLHTSLRKTWVAVGLAAAVVLVLAAAALAWRSHRQTERQKLVAALAQDPRTMNAAVQSGQVSTSEANRAIIQSETQKAQQRLHDYFALPPGKPREDYLDRLIDQIQKEIPSARAKQAATPPPPPDRHQVVGLIEEMPPAFKAQMAEFMKAMLDRIKQRGIALPGQ